ncbi:hypothetical protein JTB14_006616 [Gonioctena quinquepunctata]|nr:hypothetical protein JTB14_006616 [Gonioctena quinquepunctata]
MSQIDKLKNASSRNCNYCKNNAVILCEGIYYTSCALRIAGLTAVGKNNLVKCCSQHNSKQNPTGTTNTNVQHNTKQNSTSTANPNDNNEREHSCANNSQVPKLNNNNPNLSNTLNKSNRGLASSVFRTNNRNSEAKNPNPLTTQQLGMGILQAQTINKMDEIIQLGQEGGQTQVNNFMSSEQPWRTAKRRRKFVIGKNEVSDMVRTVPKFTSLHVTRLSPDIKPEDFQALLEPNLPGVHCELHQSMRPELYASVKVQIRQEDLGNAWKIEIWRNGAVVTRFF